MTETSDPGESSEAVHAGVPALPKKGTRAARRKTYKYPAAGPGKTLRLQWSTGHAETNKAMADAAETLVRKNVKPTLDAVLAHIASTGGKLAVATATRHAASLRPARDAWEAKHGLQPEWHRKHKVTGPADGVDAAPRCEAGPPAPAIPVPADWRARALKAEGQLKRALGELADSKRSRGRLHAELKEAMEALRRAGLA